MRNCLVFVLLAFTLPLSALVARAESALLQQVREDYATLSRATADFESTRASGSLTDAEATDFIDWINHLITKVLIGCRDLARESAAPIPADLPCSEILGSRPSSAGIDISAEQTTQEQTKGLVDQLHAALGKFDEELLQEEEKIKAKTPRSDTQGSSGSGSAGGDAGEGAEQYAGDNETDQKVAKSADGEKFNDSSNAQVAEDGGEENQRRTASDTSSTIGSSGQNLPTSAPDDIPDGSDDDVVARQIREAAEKETDPELREKLWEEYRRYKAGTG